MSFDDALGDLQSEPRAYAATSRCLPKWVEHVVEPSTCQAARLQADLRRAEIEPFGWVINSSLAATGSADPCLHQRIAAELEQIEAVRQRHAKIVAIVPWVAEGPVGPTRLLALARGTRATSRS